jgi:23S rRNA (cytidine1920-2'-O)/16S rRNA (cytidine1409-2'-O)-methyltransferase
MKKNRLDLLLLERKMASTRTKAQELIRNGKVLVNGKVTDHPGEKVSGDCVIELAEREHPYVSRGGVKMDGAIRVFSLSVAGRRALDVGQSTGGFTHCLLMNGATEVVGVEVGHGQIAEALRADPRVRTLERQDIRELKPEIGSFSLCVVDLSFISLRLIVPHLPAFLEKGADVILLVKPQFEVGPENLGSGGIVRDAKLREGALRKVEQACKDVGFTVAGSTDSPVEGGDGNKEYLLHLRWLSSPGDF